MSILIVFTPEVDAQAPPPPPPPCEELGRVTRAYVSGYQRARIHQSRIVRGESRCLVANFHGAIPLSRTIASVTWRCLTQWTVVMANARITGREVAVDITGQAEGCAWLKAQITLDNGEVYNQRFQVDVAGAPWFDGETTVMASGPAVLTAP